MDCALEPVGEGVSKLFYLVFILLNVKLELNLEDIALFS